MRRKLLIAFFAAGTLFGYGSALFGRAGACRRASYERHIADVCLEAARQAPAHP